METDENEYNEYTVGANEVTMTTSGRPRTFDEEATLARILELFRRNGYDNTTFDQLVAESGLSRSSLYNAFGGKEELLEKAMQLYMETEVEELHQSLTDEEAGPKTLGALIEAFSNPVGLGGRDCLVRRTLQQNASSSEPPVLVSTIRKSLAKLWESITYAVRRVRGATPVGRQAPASLSDEERAAIIIGLIQGTAVIARTGKQEELLRSIRSGAEKLLA